MSELKIPITAQDRTSDAFGKLGSSLDKAGRKSKSLMEKWRDLTIVGAGVSRIAKGIGRAIGSTFEAADRQQAAEARLALALRNTGREIENNLNAMKAWASERQAVTRWGDEASLELATLGVTLGNLADRDLQRAIEASQDFATATGRGATEAMQLLARAAGGGEASFSRMGLAIDPTLQGFDKFTAALDLMEERFGGMSRVMAQTAAGPLVQFSNAWGDLQEKIGLIVANTKVFRGILKWLTDAVGELANQDGIAKWAKRVDDAIFKVADAVLAVGQVIVDFFRSFTWALNEGLQVLGRFGNAFSDTRAMFADMSESAGGAARSIADLREKLAELFSGDYDSVDPANLISSMFGSMATAGEQAEGLPTPEEFAKGIIGDEDLWAQLGADYGSVFVSGMVDAFDESVAPSEAFKNMGTSAKDSFVAQVSGNAWQPINESMGKLASALASPFRVVGQLIDTALVKPVATFVESIMQEVTGFLGRLLGFAAAQQTAAAAAATQTMAMWAPITAQLAGAAVAASIASFGAASAFGPAAIAQIQAAQAVSAIPMEEGGLMLHKPGTGGTLTVLAEKEPELVIPLSQLEEMRGGGGSIAIGDITVNGGVTNDETADIILDALMERLEEERLGGRI